jgi:NAD(P)-dependent dehydrogenase (short-subunit alcohol dehydrogenase family)
MDIEDSVVLVTGANRGLGKAYAGAFVAAGAARVYAAARDGSRIRVGFESHEARAMRRTRSMTDAA